MISVNIMGGLGNELFMIFTTLAYGMANNTTVVFPTNPYMGERHTYWHSFLKELIIFTTQNPKSKITDNDVLSLPKFYEKGFHYTPLPIFHSSVLLYGYFQSPKYFDSFKNTIFRLIRLYDKQRNIRDKYPDLFKGETVSLHFRLGDYKTKRLHHSIMNYEYYESALEYIVNQKPVTKVLYCCEKEDNEYVGQQIARLQTRFSGIDFMKIPDEAEDYEQMLMMSCCSHNIIANSTFSWWGAYLNQNQDKIVVCPQDYIGPSDQANQFMNKNYYPKEWIAL
jgi:hypothetical protein